MYDRPSYITSLSSILVLTLLFGLIPQDPSIGGWLDLLGFNQMSSSWIFVLFLFHFMTVLGLKAIEDVHCWRRRSVPTILMHVAFFVILVASVFGSGEKVRIQVTAIEGHPVSMGLTDKGMRVELPFTILLKDFSLEEYPPAVHLLPDGSEVVMPRREVKKYLSEVEIWEGEEKHSFEIAVNRPASVGSWKIYQSGYDSSRGKFSTISILECVKDGSYIAVHIAMWTILLSGVLMFIMGAKKRKEVKE
jgi:cytochrome c biogenesis protein ResB